MGRRSFHFKRRGPKRDPKRKFFLFCEGRNTEPGYFGAIKRKYRTALIEINTIGPVGVPKTVAKRAIAQLKEATGKKRALNSFEEQDQVWVVFDRDDHTCYYEAIKLCDSAGVRVAKSNPCFELWLLLHEQDYDKPLGRDAVTRVLKKIRADYDPKHKVLNFGEIISRIEEAETRALKQMKARKAEGGNPLGSPYTTVGDLTQSIREAAKSAT